MGKLWHQQGGTLTKCWRRLLEVIRPLRVALAPVERHPPADLRLPLGVGDVDAARLERGADRV